MGEKRGSMECDWNENITLMKSDRGKKAYRREKEKVEVKMKVSMKVQKCVG